MNSQEEFRAFDGEFFEQDSDNNTIYTVKNHGTWHCKNPKDPTFDDWQACKSNNYGFLRVMLDKKGSLSSYVCAAKAIPDPFPSTFHIGNFYVFEEWNIGQMKDFEIVIPRWFDDRLGVHWSYDAKSRCYTLARPIAHARTDEPYFFTEDGRVISCCGTYGYNVKQLSPSRDIIELVPKILQKKNELTRSGISIKER